MTTVFGVVFAANAPAESMSRGLVSNSNRYRVVAQVKFSATPVGVGVDTGLNRTYVSAGNRVWVISGRTNKITGSVHVASPAGEMAVDSVRHEAWVLPATYPYAQVYVIDTRTNRRSATVKLPFTPFGIAIDPTSHKVYIGSSDPNAPKVAVFSERSRQLLKTFKVHGVGQAALFDPRLKRLCISTRGDREEIEVVDVRTGRTVARRHAPDYALAAAIDTDTHRAYFAGGDNDSRLVVLNTRTKEVVRRARVANAFGLAVDDGAGILFATNYSANALQILALPGLRQVQMLSVGAGPHQVTVNGRTHTVFVLNSDGNTVSVVKRHR